MEIREEVLRETYGYKGNNFWENYILSNLVRTFSSDLKELGEEAIELYTSFYGEDSSPIFKYMKENEEILHEAAQIKGELLFESVGSDNIDKYLTELSGRIFSSIEVAKLAKPSSSATKFVAGAGFLRILWGKFKGLFSKTGFANIGAFLSKGFSWAKNLVQQGVQWIAKTPILQTVVPILLVMGTVKAAKALINKMRKKSGKKAMSREEEQKFDEIAEKNKEKVKKTRKKVLNAA